MSVVFAFPTRAFTAAPRERIGLRAVASASGWQPGAGPTAADCTPALRPSGHVKEMPLKYLLLRPLPAAVSAVEHILRPADLRVVHACGTCMWHVCGDPPVAPAASL